MKVPEIHVHFEGDRRLRSAFDRFTSSLRRDAASRRFKLLMVAGKDRYRTLQNFARSLDGPQHIRSMLLVDAEGTVAEACWNKPWSHLDLLEAAKLPRPENATDDQAHLMVQAMEAWFVADRDAVADYYKQGFLPNRLPDTKDIESIPKADLVKSLRKASQKTQKGPYDKTRHAPDLLAIFDPAKVRAASRWCERLFATISEVIQGT